MKNIYIVTLLLFTINSFAQKKSHVVEINVENSLSQIDFRISKIIDNRLIKDNIGFAQKGMLNKRVPAILPDNFEPYLKTLFSKLLIPKKDSIELVAIIHEFNVSEQTKTFSEFGNFRIQIEFAKIKNEQLYSVGFVEHQIEEKGMDVTKKHSNRALEGIIYCLNEFNKNNWKNSEGELIELENNNLKFDYNSIPKPGLYSSFTKMSQNTPFLETGYKIDKRAKKKYPKYFIFDEDGKKIKKRIMGFSDGENIYVNASRYSFESHYVKSKRIGKYIYFEDRFSDPMAAVMFGLLGTVLSNTANGIILDTETGLVTILNYENLTKLLSEHQDILNEFKSSKKRLIDIENAIIALNEKLN
jgi:hypothetical protein